MPGMKWFHACAAAALVLWLAGCASSTKVRTTQDPQVDLSPYQSFVLLPLPDQISETDPDLALRVAPVITETVTQVFEQKGYESASERSADLAIYVRGKMVPHVDVTTWGYLPYYGRMGWTKGYPYAYGYNLSNDRTFEEGTLIVEVYDNDTKKMVWVGWATTPKARNRAKEAVQISDTLQRVLAPYPTVVPPETPTEE
jgi:hypothetical protein